MKEVCAGEAHGVKYKIYRSQVVLKGESSPTVKYDCYVAGSVTINRLDFDIVRRFPVYDGTIEQAISRCVITCEIIHKLMMFNKGTFE